MPKVSKAGNGASDALSKTKGTKAGSAGATQRVYLGILQDLEKHRMVPGQRLVETELALHFGVGRNAVREAMQRLAVRGVVDQIGRATSELQSLMRISYAVFCLKQKKRVLPTLQISIP